MLAGAPGRAEEVSDLSVSAFAGKSWIDLLRQALPEAAVEPGRPHVAKAARGVELRPLGDTFGDGVWGEPARVISVDARRIDIGARKRLVLFLTLDAGDAAPVLLFEGEGEGRMLDAVNVKKDQLVSLAEPALRPLGAAGTLMTTRSTHSNSNQSYEITSLTLVGAERFAPIGTVLTFGDRDCRGAMTQDLAVSTRRAEPMARIDLAVTRIERKMAADCQTPQGRNKRTTIRGAYVWDAAKGGYVGRRAALDKLGKDNEGRF